jgi:hypothetical protein
MVTNKKMTSAVSPKSNVKDPEKSVKPIRHIANTDICYVCGKEVKRETQEYWESPPSDKYPDGVIRHEECALGTDNWKESPRAKVSPLASYFIKDDGEPIKKKPTLPPLETIVKEFIGQVKYMVYMNSRLEESDVVEINWAIATTCENVEVKAEGSNKRAVVILAAKKDSKGKILTTKAIPFQSKDTLGPRIIQIIKGL